jgi:hypothetical protein
MHFLTVQTIRPFIPSVDATRGHLSYFLVLSGGRGWSFLRFVEYI